MLIEIHTWIGPIELSSKNREGRKQNHWRWRMYFMGEKKKVPLGDPRRLKILVSFETATSKKPDRWKYKEIETSNDLVGSKSYGESRRLDD